MISKSLSPCGDYDLVLENGQRDCSILHHRTGIVVAQGTATGKLSVAKEWRPNIKAIQAAALPWRALLQMPVT